MKRDSTARGRGRKGINLPPTGWLYLAAGLLALLAAPGQAEIIDRVVAVVGQQAITASEVELQLRLEAMFNREPFEATDAKRHEALQRLIAVRLIQSEALMTGFLKISEAEVQRHIAESKQERYLNGISFDDALQLYQLREQDVTAFWRQVIGYERFKDFRFKTGLEVSRDEVSAYYQSHIVPEFKAEGNGSPPPLDDIYDKVEQAAIEDRANALLEEWLKETRPQTRIVILKEEPQTTPPQPDQRQPARQQTAPAGPPARPTGDAPR